MLRMMRRNHRLTDVRTKTADYLRTRSFDHASIPRDLNFEFLILNFELLLPAEDIRNKILLAV